MCDRYAPGDPVESWLNELLCLDAQQHLPRPPPRLPHPDQCELYYVERDTLFSFHKVRMNTLLCMATSTANQIRGHTRHTHGMTTVHTHTHTHALVGFHHRAAHTQTYEQTLCMAVRTHMYTHAHVQDTENAVQADRWCFHVVCVQASERFLQQMVSLYVSSHYKNTPNDLLLMADAPAHHLFALLAPVDETQVRVCVFVCVFECVHGVW